MDGVVSTSDETERCLSVRVYSKEIKARAIVFSEKGAGYKCTASVIGIKRSNVRGWVRR